jgi:hypothetical protein
MSEVLKAYCLHHHHRDYDCRLPVFVVHKNILIIRKQRSPLITLIILIYRTFLFQDFYTRWHKKSPFWKHWEKLAAQRFWMKFPSILCTDLVTFCTTCTSSFKSVPPFTFTVIFKNVHFLSFYVIFCHFMSFYVKYLRLCISAIYNPNLLQI